MMILVVQVFHGWNRLGDDGRRDGSGRLPRNWRLHDRLSHDGMLERRRLNRLGRYLLLAGRQRRKIVKIDGLDDRRVPRLAEAAGGRLR
ncbi:MAG: hypothetical protein V4479_14205, partial [Actinomycetota bacterium]